MATIRRVSRLSRPPAAPSAAVVAIVLGGWRAKPPAGESEKDGVVALAGNWGIAAASPNEVEDAFDLCMAREAGVIRVWKRYEGYLREEAVRLGIVPPYRLPDGRRLYFGQLMQLPAAERYEADDVRYGGDDDVDDGGEEDN